MGECFSFPFNPSICQVLSMKEYLARTAPLCHTDAKSVFIFLIQSQKCVTLQTLAIWVIELMADVGIDNYIFKEYSTSSASAQQIRKTIGMSAAQISKTASWSAKYTAFREFYNKVVLQTEQKKEAFRMYFKVS